jgi:hypothetical protein
MYSRVLHGQGLLFALGARDNVDILDSRLPSVIYHLALVDRISEEKACVFEAPLQHIL